MKLTTPLGRDIDLTSICDSFSKAEISKDKLIEEISRGLANTLRFSGQLGGLTVAQHSLSVARIARVRRQSKQQELINLLHDASEGYLGDIPTPLKRLLPDYQKLEAEVMGVIHIRLLGRHPFYSELERLHAADRTAFEREVTAFSEFPFPCYGMTRGVRLSADPTERCLWTRAQAYTRFLENLVEATR